MAATTSKAAERRSGLARALDFASDWGILVYAAWTLVAYGGMLTQASVTVLTWVWLASVPLFGVALGVLQRRANGPEEQSAAVAGAPSGSRRRQVAAVGIAAAGASAALAAAARDVPWPAVWVPAFVAVVAAVAAGRLGSRPEARAVAAPGWPRDVFAAVVGLGLAAMSLFINDSNADDVFYVNRATATTQLDRIPVRDVLLTHEAIPPLRGTGLPVDSFAALQGALGHLFGVHPASVVYYATPPVMTFLAVWALWRLLRAWAPARAPLCFALASVYWIWSAEADFTPGYFFLTRIWQGKVAFVAFLVPVLYTYVTHWLARPSRPTAVLMIAAGVCALGMTGSATFVVPLIAVVALLASALVREWGRLPVVVAAAAFPFLVGFVLTRRYPLGEAFAEGLKANGTYFYDVFGLGVVAAVGALGLWTAPWLAASGPPARLTTAIAIVAALLLVPGLFTALHDVAGLTGTLRRTLWVVPLPALVGLLALVPTPQPLGRWAAAAPALLAAGVLVAFGHALWFAHADGDRLLGAAWTPRPTWKTNVRALADARAILARYHPSGPILADKPIMRAVSLLTVDPKAVNPRTLYAHLAPEPLRVTRERVALTRFVMARASPPPPPVVRNALAGLGVGLVCVDAWKHRVIREVEAAGPYRRAFRARGLVCLRRAGG